MEKLKQIEADTQQINEMVSYILKDISKPLDEYVNYVTVLLNQVDILPDSDLDKIAIDLPPKLYAMIEVIQEIEASKVISKERANMAKNDILLTATGTVAEKTAKAENNTIEDRLKQLAYNTASSILQKKVDGALQILDSVKKVRSARIKEKSLTSLAGSSVASF